MRAKHTNDSGQPDIATHAIDDVAKRAVTFEPVKREDERPTITVAGVWVELRNHTG